MNIKKVFGVLTAVIGIMFLIAVILIFLNSAFSECRVGDVYINSSKECYSFERDCKMDEGVDTYDGKKVCIYEPEGFLSLKLVTNTLIFLGIGWFIVFIIYIINIMGGNGSKKLAMTGFKKEDFVYMDKVKKLWALWWSYNYGVSVIGDSYNEQAFDFYTASEPAQLGKEWFAKFQCEVLEGNYPGIFTVCTSMSRGEEWISKGMASWKQCGYNDYKRKRDWPIHTPEDIRERSIEALYERHPERAVELQEQIIERSASQPAPTVDNMEGQQSVIRPSYNRRRPTYNRRRY